MDCINKIPSGEAPGFDGLSPFVIKQASYALAKPLAEIFNKCLTAGIFPDTLKIAQVIPIYKKGCKNEFTNYRPISVLSAFSKLFEKLIYKRLISFIDEHNIISESQFGFRKNRSTEMATSYVISKLCNAIDHNGYLFGLIKSI